MDNFNQLTKTLSRAVKLRIMQEVIIYSRTANLMKDIERAKRSKVYIEVDDLTAVDSQAEVIKYIQENPEMKRLNSTDLNLSMLNIILSEDESEYKLMNCIVFQRRSLPTLCIKNKRVGRNNDGVSILVDLSDVKIRLSEHYRCHDFYYSLAWGTAIVVGATLGIKVTKDYFDSLLGRN